MHFAFRTVSLIGALVASLVLPATPARSLHLRGDGMAFPDALPGIGEALEIVGRLDPADCDAPFEISPEINEYTWTIYGPVVHFVDDPAPGIRTLYLTFGILELREDSRRNSMFFADPPNSAVPSSFHDGETVLFGTITDLRIREIFGIFTASALITFQTGNALPDLGTRVAWNLASGISPFDEELPPGFGSSWSIELTPNEPIGVESTSWGGIKALYR